MTHQKDEAPTKQAVEITIARDWGTITVKATIDIIDGLPELFETTAQHHAADCGPYTADRWRLTDTLARFPGNVSDFSVMFNHKTLEIVRPLADGGQCRMIFRSYGHYQKLPSAARDAFMTKLRTFDPNGSDGSKVDWARAISEELSRGGLFPSEMLVSITYVSPPTQAFAPAPFRTATSPT